MTTNATMRDRNGKQHAVCIFQCGRGYWRIDNEFGNRIGNAHGKRETIRMAQFVIDAPKYDPKRQPV